MRHRLQNAIAESTLTLPLTAVVATLLWWLPQGGYTSTALHAWFVAALTTYFVIELTTANALLRTRSQMAAVLVLAFLGASGYLHTHRAALIIMLAAAMAHHYLLHTAPQSSSADDVASSRGGGGLGGFARAKNRPQVATFHAFACLSLGSIEWPPLLLFALPLLWSQAIYLRSITWRCLGAALIGIVLPYTLWAAAALFAKTLAEVQQPTPALIVPDTTSPAPATPASALGAQLTFAAFTAHCEAIIAPVAEPVTTAISGQFPTPQPYAMWLAAESGAPAAVAAWMTPRLARCLLLAVAALLALTGFVHYVRRSYDDKIRVRMSHYTFLTTMAVAALWLALQPRHFDHLFPLLVLAMAPSAAHFVALTRTWLTNAWVVVLALALVAVGVVNLVPDVQAYMSAATAYVRQLL